MKKLNEIRGQKTFFFLSTPPWFVWMADDTIAWYDDIHKTVLSKFQNIVQCLKVALPQIKYKWICSY